MLSEKQIEFYKNSEEEHWLSVVGYKGIYEVSTNGRLRSLDRYVNHYKGGLRFIKGGVSNQSVDDCGYYYFCLSKNKIKKIGRIHQLIAESFLNHTPNGYALVVNHIDHNPLNNHLFNLEVVTQRQNSNKKHLKSTSDYVGVYLNKSSKKWQSCILFNGSRIHLGLFDNEKEASRYYQNALISIENHTKIKVKNPNFSSKYKGVHWVKNKNRWMAQSYINGKQKYVGLYKTEIEAHLAIVKCKT